MSLYTKKGDDGTTGVFSGERIKKSSCNISALGSIDELNSFLGLCKVEARKVHMVVGSYYLADIIHKIQNSLFIVQAEVAGADKKITEDKVLGAEKLIDLAESELQPMKSFFISGGTELGARLDVARTLVRRAEREVWGAFERNEIKVSDETKKYLNRLSDLMFALARLTNQKSGINEEPPRY